MQEKVIAKTEETKIYKNIYERTTYKEKTDRVKQTDILQNNDRLFYRNKQK